MWRKIYCEMRRWAKASDRAVAAYKRTEITLETDRVWILRKPQTARMWCPGCGREIDVLQRSEAAALPATTQPVVNQPLLADREGDTVRGSEMDGTHQN